MRTLLGIYDELLRISRQANSFQGVYGSSLPLTEAQVLTEIIMFPRITGRDLVARIGIEKSTLSRVITALEREGFLKVTPSPSDRRALQLSITTKGEKVIGEVDSISEKYVRDNLSAYTQAEQVELRSLFQEMSDRAGTSPIPMRKGEHLVRSELRRFGRTMGLLRAQSWASTLSLREREILFAARKDAGGISARTIADDIGMKESNLSQLARVLLRRGLINRKIDPLDSRRSLISITNKGESELARYEKSMSNQLHEMFGGVSERKLARLYELLKKFRPPIETQKPRSPALHMTILKSESERRLARALYVEGAIRAGRQLELPESLFSSKNRSFGAYRDGKLCAACEYVISGGDWIGQNLWIADDVSSHEQGEFFDFAINTLAGKGQNVLVPDSWQV